MSDAMDGSWDVQTVTFPSPLRRWSSRKKRKRGSIQWHIINHLPPSLSPCARSSMRTVASQSQSSCSWSEFLITNHLWLPLSVAHYRSLIHARLCALTVVRGQINSADWTDCSVQQLTTSLQRKGSPRDLQSRLYSLVSPWQADWLNRQKLAKGTMLSCAS